MSLKPYPEYKESRIEWLGSIPGSWPTKRMSWLFRIISSGTTPPNEKREYYDGEFNWVTTGELREREIFKTKRTITSEAISAFATLRVYPAGTLLIAMYGATIGRLGFLGAPATTNQACCAFTGPVQTIPRFIFYVLLSAREHLLVISDGGGQPNINQDKLRSLRIPHPTYQEQEAIVSYLDRETAEIDAFIEDQEELIALLGERRTATITRAVTKGLNPDVRMNTGVLDDVEAVPFHWSVSRLKWGITKIESGTSVNAQDVPVSGRDEVGVLKTSSVYTGEFDPSKNKTVITEDLHRVTCLVRANTLIVSRMNTPQLVAAAGRPSRDEPNIYLPDRLWQVYFHESWETQFVHFWTQTRLYRTQVEAVCMGTSSSMQNIGQDDFRNFVLHLPPQDEQRSIVAYLLVEMAEIDAAIADAREAIALSKERRAAVISAAVTGKIDVRGALAPVTKKVEAEPVGVA